MERFRWLSDLSHRPEHTTARTFAGEASLLLGSVDRDGKLRFLNLGWERVLGYDLQEKRGGPLVELIPLERAAADRLVSRLLDSTHSDPVEICLWARDGTRKRFLWHRRFDPQEDRTYIAGEEINERDVPARG